MATTMRALAQNVPLTNMEMTTAAPGAMDAANGGIINAAEQMLVRNIGFTLAQFKLIINISGKGARNLHVQQNVRPCLWEGRQLLR